jgi:hypothetical protein
MKNADGIDITMMENDNKLLKMGGYEIPENVYSGDTPPGISNNVVNQIIYNAINNYTTESITDVMYLITRVKDYPVQIRALVEFCSDIIESKTGKEK